MKNKKEILKKITLLLAGTVGATVMTGCDENNTKDQELIEYNVDLEDDILDIMIEEAIKTTINTTNTSSQMTTTSTKETTSYETSKLQYTELTTEMTTQTETTTYSTQTTEEQTTELQATSNNVDLNEITLEQYIETNKYRIIDGIYDVTINEETESLQEIANKYQPENVSIDLFVEELKILNNKKDNTLSLGEVIKVPAKLIYYKSKLCALSVSNANSIKLEKICELNNLSFEENNEYKEPGEERELLIKVLPIDAKTYQTDNGTLATIYNNNVIINKTIIPCGKTYGEGYVNSAIFITNTSPYHNEYSFVQFKNDGSYSSYYIGNNIENASSLNGIPVMEVRNESTCNEYSKTTGNDYSLYSTVINTENPSEYHFYENEGKIFFTFDSEDLCKYGYKKADNLSEYYIELPDYLTEDKTK